MSALPPKADISGYQSNVCFVPEADIEVPRMADIPREIGTRHALLDPPGPSRLVSLPMSRACSVSASIWLRT